MNKSTHQVIYSLSCGGRAIVPARVAAKFAQDFRRSSDKPDMFSYFLKKGSDKVTVLICQHVDNEKLRQSSDYIEIGTPLAANTWRNYI